MKSKQPRTGNPKEDRVRDETDALIAEAEKYVGPLDIHQQQIAYAVCKEAAKCKRMGFCK